MKEILFTSIIIALLPVYSFAHGGSMMDFNELQTGPEMMEYVEDSALGEELHEEMEDLMLKMMSGTLTQTEADRTSQLMGQYPGPYGMMMNRLGWSGNSGSGWSMMSGWNSTVGWGIVWLWVLVLSGFVWLAVGILLLIWLIRKAFGLK
jgi:hypothetical protein